MYVSYVTFNYANAHAGTMFSLGLNSSMVPRSVQEHAHIVNMSLFLPLFMCVFYVLYAECNNRELV